MRIGIDFGGTKIEAAALDASGAFIARIREPNPGTYDAAISLVADLIARVEAEAGPAHSVGLAIPGSLSPRTGLIRNANSIYLNGRCFGDDLEATLGRPVRLANDANCLALSESADGAGVGAASLFGVILGTGCGGGLVIDGKLVEGAQGVAAEIGHISLPWPSADEAPGPACWCGLHGCLETWVSGTGFQRDHEAATGRARTAQAIVDVARAGDVQAVAALNRYIGRLGRALAMVVNLADPEVFVLGGGMSNVDELYDRLPQVVARHVFSDHWDGRIVPAKWGDSSGVRGAARLWGA
ncbi:ROK family protein [Brevundimonas naejangsanensis]|uniref:ROK family protein n=1 Tax=Brevundimonas naejangsanensis TaxID=588932 RepID=UPI00040B324C|nr:ROK family protein [Brevundimonas naejangsanensis]